MEAGWYELLLFSDIKTITNICQCNQRAYQICNDKHFWIQKFNHDNMAIITMQNTLAGWMKEYSNILTCKINVDIMIKNIMDRIHKSDAYIGEILYQIMLDQYVNYESIPKFITHIIETEKTIVGSKKIILSLGIPQSLKIATNDNKILIAYYFRHGDQDRFTPIIILKETIEKLLFDIYYYMNSTNTNIDIIQIV